MRSNIGERRYVFEAIGSKLRGGTLNGMMVAVMLATAASLFLMSTGMPETALVPLVSVVGILALGLVLCHIFEYLKVEDASPIAEDGSRSSDRTIPSGVDVEE